MAVSYNTTIDQGATWYINFIYKQPAEITNVVGNGTTVTYTCGNAFAIGQTVSIDGVIPDGYNLQNKVIANSSSTFFTVTNATTGTYISGGIATVPMNLTSRRKICKPTWTSVLRPRCLKISQVNKR